MLILSKDHTTLREWLQTWLYDLKRHEIKPLSLRKYEGLIQNYILPAPFIDSVLETIRPMHYQAYLYELGDTAGKATANNVRQVLVTALNDALRFELVDKNTASLTKPFKLPRRLDPVERTLTLKEQKAFLDVIRNQKYEIAYLLALNTGARNAEVRALLWSDINVRKRTITINKQISKTLGSFKGASKDPLSVCVDVKGQIKVRHIPITKAFIDRLALEKRRSDYDLLSKGLSPSPFIVHNASGDPIGHNTLQRKLQDYLRQAHIDKKDFHALRHAFATRLFESGAAPRTAQALLGHTSQDMTMQIYTHVSEYLKRDAILSLSSYLENEE